jgi:hypothetical protein
MSGRSSDTSKVGPCSWIAPITETDPVVIGSAAERNDQADKDETKEAEDLDAGSNDFGLAKSPHQRTSSQETHILTFNMLIANMSTRPIVMTTAGVISLQ